MTTTSHTMDDLLRDLQNSELDTFAELREDGISAVCLKDDSKFITPYNVRNLIDKRARREYCTERRVILHVGDLITLLNVLYACETDVDKVVHAYRQVTIEKFRIESRWKHEQRMQQLFYSSCIPGMTYVSGSDDGEEQTLCRYTRITYSIVRHEYRLIELSNELEMYREEIEKKMWKLKCKRYKQYSAKVLASVTRNFPWHLATFQSLY